MAAAASPGSSCPVRAHVQRQEQDLDPYGIWIAEVMLQQTQLAVALSPTGRVGWRRFPLWRALAAASLDEVRLQWQGLGYYSRVAPAA